MDAVENAEACGSILDLLQRYGPVGQRQLFVPPPPETLFES